MTEENFNEDEKFNNEYIKLTKKKNDTNTSLDKKKNFWGEYNASGAACMGMLLSGLHFCWIGPTLPLLLDKNSRIPITSAQVPLVSGFLQIGAVPGSILGSIIGDWCGRKRAMLLITIPFLLSSITLYFAQDIYDLYISRALGGFGVGACFSIIPMYIGEITSPEIRGTVGVYKGLAINLGVLQQFCIAPFVSIETNALICAVIPIFMFVWIALIPETPYYYLQKDQIQLAKQSLQRLRSTKDVSEELNRLIDGKQLDSNETNVFLDLFRIQTNRKILFIICGLLTFQQYGGASAVFTYSQVFLQKANISISIELCGILLALTNFLIVFVCGSLIDVLGRRPLFLFSCIFCSVFIGILGIYFHLQEVEYSKITALSLVPPIALILYKFAFGMGLGPIPYISLGELFPTSVRASAVGFASVYGSFCGFTVTKLYQVVTDSFGESVSFYGFCVINIIGAVFVFNLLPETKGRTLEDIQKGFHKNDGSKC